ncbi:MAG: ATP-binding cassette domain-containing protein [Bacillota bacterium]|jgi:Fe-S cluster assembly ATP-binding protein
MLKIMDLTYKAGTEEDADIILNNINLTLEENKIYVITGPNGGGKSSLAKIVMGIVQPVSGKIFLNGRDITGLDITERAKLGIGYAFQQPPRFKGIKVAELLKIAALQRDKTVNICNLLYDVGLCARDYLNRELDAGLSGGEMKRIEIATILSRDLQVAIFDEPEAGIDLWSFQKLAETFCRMHAKYNTIIVIISHQERILNLADEVILLVKGQVEEKAAKEEILPRIIREESCRCGTNY